MSETFCAFAGMMSLTSNSILCNFITSWELVKAPQNVIQTRLFSRKINKSINDCNWTRTQNHVVRKQTLNHLAKLVRVQLQWLNLQILRLLRARSSLTFRQLQSVDSLWNAYVTWQEHTVTKTCHKKHGWRFGLRSSCLFNNINFWNYRYLQSKQRHLSQKRTATKVKIFLMSIFDLNKKHAKIYFLKNLLNSRLLCDLSAL